MVLQVKIHVISFQKETCSRFDDITEKHYIIFLMVFAKTKVINLTS